MKGIPMTPRMLRALQRRIAETSIGASTVRNMGPSGTARVAREWLAHLDLSSFSRTREEQFRRRLNTATTWFQKSLPREGRRGGYWGTARKCLNIFLRNVVYNRHLCRAHKLECIEKWLEVPLDSHVAIKLREEQEGRCLNSWPGVIDLEKEISAKYQEVALRVARRRNTLRIHMDCLYWRHP